MRNRNHNRRGVLNTSNPDWHEDRGNYGHGYQNHGYDNDRGSDNFNYGNNYGYGSSIGGRYDNSGSGNYSRGSYGDTQYSRDSGLNRSRYQGDRDEGFQGYNNDWRSSYGQNSRDYLNYGSERGSNDRARDEYRYSDSNRGGGYQGGSNYGGGNYGSDYNRNRGGDHDNERGWWDRTSDEVSSWFGDEDAERRREWDKSHRGKGPKGYSRSDDRIKEDINDRLSDDIYVDASEIEVTVSQGEVTLTGSVSQRNEKRRAEDIAEQVSGVKNVENRIRLSQNESKGDRWDTSSQENRGVGSTVSSSNRNKVKETLN